MTDTDILDRPDTSSALRVDRDALLTAVRAVSQTVERRNTIPILSNVLLRVENGFLTVCATDLDHLSTRIIDCDGAEIDTTVEAERLITAVDTLRPGAIELSYVHGALTIKQARSTRKLMTLSSADFPIAQPRGDGVKFAMDAAPLYRVLDTARVAVSTEQTRYYLCGVFVQVIDGEFIAAATDGHRVVQVRHAAPPAANGAPDSIIGTKAVNLICRMLDDLPDGAQVEVTLADGRFLVSAGRSSLGGKLVDGTFPDYRRVLRQDHAFRMTIQAAEFDRSIRAAGSLSDGKTRAVRLDLSPGHCEASGAGQDGGRSNEPMEGDFDGHEIAIGINLAYASSVAKMFGSTPKLMLGFGREANEVIIITSDDRPGMTAGVMPMRA